MRGVCFYHLVGVGRRLLLLDLLQFQSAAFSFVALGTESIELFLISLSSLGQGGNLWVRSRAPFLLGCLCSCFVSIGGG